MNVLSLNLEDETTKIKHSNQIAWNWRGSWIDQGRLDNTIEMANIVAWEKEKFSRSSQTDQEEYDN